MLGIAARPTYGLMDLTEEARRAAAYPANRACVRASTTLIADLAGTDAKVVFVARHQTTIGSRTMPSKS
jgi:hypothetical protein